MQNNTTVRRAADTDYASIYELIKTAFLTAAHRDGDEQDFAVRLRSGKNYIPELELVAECGDRLAGHIMLTKTYVTRPDGSIHHTLLVAPLSVLPEHQHSGIGSALMKEGLRIAGEMGYGTAFLIGDPDYYRRFGYELSSLHGINHASFPAEYVMVKQIMPGALDGITGIVEM